MFIVHCLFNSVGFRSPLFRKNRAMRQPITNSLVLHFYRLCLTVNTLLPATYPYCSTPYITLTSILRKLRDAGCCSPAPEQRSRRHRLIRFLTCIASRLCRRKAILAARWRHRLNVIGALIQRSEAKTREVGDVSGGDEQKGMIYYLRGCCYQGYDGCRCCCCLRLRLIVGCYYRPIQADLDGYKLRIEIFFCNAVASAVQCQRRSFCFQGTLLNARGYDGVMENVLVGIGRKKNGCSAEWSRKSLLW